MAALVPFQQSRQQYLVVAPDGHGVEIPKELFEQLPRKPTDKQEAICRVDVREISQ